MPYIENGGVAVKGTEIVELGETAARVYREWENGDREEIRRCRERFAKACDGHATERILRYLDACSEQK